jgi:hypothetical protein
MSPRRGFVSNELKVFAFLLFFHFFFQVSLLCRGMSISLSSGNGENAISIFPGGPPSYEGFLGRLKWLVARKEELSHFWEQESFS